MLAYEGTHSVLWIDNNNVIITTDRWGELPLCSSVCCCMFASCTPPSRTHIAISHHARTHPSYRQLAPSPLTHKAHLARPPHTAVCVAPAESLRLDLVWLHVAAALTLTTRVVD